VDGEEKTYPAGSAIPIHAGGEVLVYFGLSECDQDPVPKIYADALKAAGFIVYDEPVFIENMPYMRVGAGELAVGASADVTVAWIRFADAFGDPPVPQDQWEYLAAAGYTFTVIAPMYGDATGDGKIDTADLIRLANVLADPNVEHGLGADADADGDVTEADLALLLEYLAAFDFGENESSVKLGPKA
ncbi:MAG: hypothetical protein II776_00725, partial [Clostridia bacterium]|nr:hypothetical protein [Clostridia bacterium]